MLFIVCEVCTTPLPFQEKYEKLLLMSTYVVCPVCEQLSKVPKELREEISEKTEIDKNW